jgi:hypothetical protein
MKKVKRSKTCKINKKLKKITTYINHKCSQVLSLLGVIFKRQIKKNAKKRTLFPLYFGFYDLSLVKISLIQFNANFTL